MIYGVIIVYLYDKHLKIIMYHFVRHKHRINEMEKYILRVYLTVMFHRFTNKWITYYFLYLFFNTNLIRVI